MATSQVPKGKFILHYLDINGRGIAARVALKHAGFDFDERISSFSELFKMREGKDGAPYNQDIPLGTLPILIFPDGKRKITQSSAIARFAARYCGLYPSDPMDAIIVDDIMDTASDFITMAPKNADPLIKKQLREEYALKQLPKYLLYIENRLNESDGPFILGKDINIGDIVLFGYVDLIVSKELDYVPVEVFNPYPLILNHYYSVKQHPIVTSSNALISRI